MPYKVLILEPVRDDAASRREAQVHSAPSLQQHDFEHMYAAEQVTLDQTVPMRTRLVRSQQKPLDENALLQRVNERVTAFQADILLVHSGPLFQSCLEEMLLVMQRLKTLHPQLRIGFWPRAFEKYRPRPFFEYSTELRDLMAQVFTDGQR